jgi:hypothetical protein
MATPEERTSSTPATTTGATASRTPAVPGGRPVPVEPVPVVSPLGWILILVSGIGLIAATWMLYPIDYDGMWGGYRDGLIGTVVVICAMWLNTSLPKQPALGLVALGGVLTVLFAVFLDNPVRVFVAEMVFGIMMLVGVALYAGGRRS